MSSGEGDVSLDNLAPVIKDVIKEQGSKDAVSGMLDKGLINEVVSDDDTASVLTEVLNPLVKSDKVDDSTIDNDIAAGQQIVDIVDAVKNNGGDLGLGESETERDAAADAIIKNLLASEAMMNSLSTSVQEGSGSTVVRFTQNVSAKDKTNLANSIKDVNTTTENKTDTTQ